MLENHGMLNTDLYRKSSTYDFFFRLLGIENSIDRYLRSLDLRFPEEARILDIGCGTGILGLHFLERLKGSTLLAGDLEPNFLESMLANAVRRGLDTDRITTGRSDIGSPQIFTPTDGDQMEFAAGTFHVICIGAVIGYSGDTENSLRQLLKLLAPGGYLINIEMNENLGGRYVSQRFAYSNIPLDRMIEIIADAGFHQIKSRLGLKSLPACITRTSIIAQRPAESPPCVQHDVNGVDV